jgi:TetR/AcrR family transcriptional repressor of mexJK operon
VRKSELHGTIKKLLNRMLTKSRKRAYKTKVGRPSAAHAKLRDANLRQVATEVFLEFGYEHANLAEIARRAGASKETLYSQYATKADLFVAVIKSDLEFRLRHFTDLIDEGRGPLEEHLKNFAFRLLGGLFADGNQSISMVVFAEAGRFPELGKHLWEIACQRQAQVEAYLKRQIADGLLAKADPTLMAQQFLHLIVAEMSLKSVLNVQRKFTAAERRAQADGAVDTFLRAYSKRIK